MDVFFYDPAYVLFSFIVALRQDSHKDYLVCESADDTNYVSPLEEIFSRKAGYDQALRRRQTTALLHLLHHMVQNQMVRHFVGNLFSTRSFLVELHHHPQPHVLFLPHAAHVNALQTVIDPVGLGGLLYLEFGLIYGM